MLEWLRAHTTETVVVACVVAIFLAIMVVSVNFSDRKFDACMAATHDYHYCAYSAPPVSARAPRRKD